MLVWNPIDSFSGNFTDPALTARRSCPVCGGDNPVSVVEMRDFQFFTDSAVSPKRVELCDVRCDDCAALYLNPAYTPCGFQTLFAEAGCSYGATAGRPREQLDWLSERGLLHPGKCLLDVGCYDGRFLSLLPATVRKVGVDIDKPAIERGRLHYGAQGIELIHGDFDSFKLDKQVDAITMFHVLEHLPDPLATLRNLRKLATSMTALVVEVPILENGFTNDINGFFSVQHMTHFSRRSLANLLARAGWSIEERLEQPDYNGCRVLCRPAPETDSVTGATEDRATLAAYLRHHRDVVADVQRQLTSLAGAERILLWGGGLHTELLYQLTDLFRVPGRRFLIVDSDPLKQGKSWRGIAICAPEILRAGTWGETPLVISSYGGQNAIHDAAVQAGFKPESMVRLYRKFRVY